MKRWGEGGDMTDSLESNRLSFRWSNRWIKRACMTGYSSWGAKTEMFVFSNQIWSYLYLVSPCDGLHLKNLFLSKAKSERWYVTLLEWRVWVTGWFFFLWLINTSWGTYMKRWVLKGGYFSCSPLAIFLSVGITLEFLAESVGISSSLPERLTLG